MSFINKIKEIRKSNQEAGYNDLGAMLKGKWSLARTFWGYWFLCNIIINIIYSFTEKKLLVGFTGRILSLSGCHCIHRSEEHPGRK
ncbi:hypothetical protein OLZ31_20690 [Enterobacter asburiae]|nr:hypothetical protein [Enterobacter asburiae]